MQDYADWVYGTSTDPGIETQPAPIDFGRAIAASPDLVTGTTFVDSPSIGRPTAIATAPVSYFPQQGSNYGVLSTGDATQIDAPGNASAFNLNGGNLRGNSDYDVTVVAVDLNVPEGDNYLSFDFQFLTEEYPVFVDPQFDDAFIAELDNTTWTTDNGVITAPDDFAVTPSGQAFTVETALQYGLSPQNAIGTAFDGGQTTGTGDPNGAGTVLLRATTAITPGHHTLYLSIFNQGDHLMDSTVLLDNLTTGHSATSVTPGVSEPLGVQVMPDPTYDAGSYVVITGHATSGAGIASVTINGVPVDVIDAAGNYYDRVTILPGDNVYDVVVTDNDQNTTTTTLTLPGVQRDPTQPDFSVMADASASIVGEYHRTSLDQRPDNLYADVQVANQGQYEIDAPLLVGVIDISDPTVRVIGNDGVTPDGIPYYDLSSLVSGGKLLPGESTGQGTLAFANPKEHQFTYKLVVLGMLNEAPRFTTVPVVDGTPGQDYAYQSAAVDPDHDNLTFSLLAGPDGMTVDESTGAIAWTPAADGTYSVALKVSDGRGGSDVQRYVISVHDALPNRPPYFVTTPVTEAYVNIRYAYASQAVDPDGDPLTYSLVQAPDGMTIDPDTGVISWVPGNDQLGEQQVIVEATDHHGTDQQHLTADQPYTVLVQNQPGNHPPVIVSTPSTLVELHADANPPSGDVQPPEIDLGLLPSGSTASRQVSVTIPDTAALNVPPRHGCVSCGRRFRGRRFRAGRAVLEGRHVLARDRHPAG